MPYLKTVIRDITMADINSFNSGESSSSYGNYPVGGNNNIQPAAKVNVNESESGYSHSWKRMPRPFGMNVRVPQAPIIGYRTKEVIKRALGDLIFAPAKEIAKYLKKNENVFNGSIAAQINSLEKQREVTIELLQEADDAVMSDVPNFMMDM